MGILPPPLTDTKSHRTSKKVWGVGARRRGDLVDAGGRASAF